MIFERNGDMQEGKWGYALSVITLCAVGLLVLSFTFNLVFYGRIASKGELIGELQEEHAAEVWEWQARHRDALLRFEEKSAWFAVAEEENAAYRSLVGFEVQDSSGGAWNHRKALQKDLDRLNGVLQDPIPRSELTLEKLVARLLDEQKR